MYNMMIMINETIEQFLKNDFSKILPKVGQIINGRMLLKKGVAIYVDIGPYQTGVIYGMEYYVAKELLKSYKPGDELVVKVKELENDEGYVELSFKEAGEENLFDELRKKMQNKEIITVKIKGANKGGLMAEVSLLSAFLPASQLSSENYPKVDDASPAKIAQELAKFVNQDMEVQIITVDQNERKVIISQKEIERKVAEQDLKNYKVDDIVSGEISGIIDFGIFVKFKIGEKNYDFEGMIPLSETINKETLKIGDKINVKIINKEGSKVYFSMKGI